MFVVLWAVLQVKKWYKNCAEGFGLTKDTEIANKRNSISLNLAKLLDQLQSSTYKFKFRGLKTLFRN